MTSRYRHPRLPHRFSPGSKLFFGTVVGWLTCWVRSYGSCDMEHAAPGSVLRASRSSNASSGLPGPPAGGRGEDGRIHNDCSRYSPAAQREVASLCFVHLLSHFLYISIVCVGVSLVHRCWCVRECACGSVSKWSWGRVGGLCACAEAPGVVCEAKKVLEDA